MSIQAFLRGYKLPYNSPFFTSTPLTFIIVNSKINSKILSICVNILKLAHAPTHLLSFTIFWCIFIVYTSINGLIQCISSIIIFQYFLNRMNFCFVVSIQKLHKNHKKIGCEYFVIKRWLRCRDILHIYKISNRILLKIVGWGLK